jgi:hypothetical protein
MVDTVIAPTAFVAVPVTTASQPATQIVNLNAAPLVIDTATAVNLNTATAWIQNAFESDRLVNTAGNTAAAPPDNFHFVDYTVNVRASIPGDVFKGVTPSIAFQFLDLTPDNLGITALSPSVFIKSGSGNDVLVADSGRNILSADSGLNMMVGSTTGKDTFLADASTANATASILNFHTGDDAAILGLNASDFTYTLKDSVAGLEIAATPATLTGKISAEIVLPGFTVSDIGTRLSLGVSSTNDGKSFFFVHGN